ncbi:MAG: NADAR family protein [Acidobacteria bacterium]|nr:NADAR family protein [Acidobacteriota bacterium]
MSYPTAEHFMMAEKARIFGDEDVRARILKAASPRAAKQLGRQVKNFKEEVWQAWRRRL